MAAVLGNEVLLPKIVMSNYYTMQDAKVAIAEYLMRNFPDEWKVYKYSPGESDCYTDYFDPPYWGGVAEKDGYIFVVDACSDRKQEEIRHYHTDESISYSASVLDKIKKLERMTVERGASVSEEESAKAMIERLKQKAAAQDSESKYDVVGYIPAHHKNPPRCNWHIEKDGVIILKGNGLLKFAPVEWDIKQEQIRLYRTDKARALEEHRRYLVNHGMRDDKIESCMGVYCKNMDEKVALIEAFEAFMMKIHTTCGGLIGNGPAFVYEKIKVTELKTVNKVRETKDGSIKEGQCFVLKANFSYGCRKGFVYQIEESEYKGKTHYRAYKLNGKLNKKCTGHANSSNYWGSFGDKFKEWLEKGYISWCEIIPEEVPVTREKVVKKKLA